MPMDDSNPQCTVGRTRFHQGENQTQLLFCIEPGIPCKHARKQASAFMGYARNLSAAGVMEDAPQLMWAAHYLSGLAKALLDDAELGLSR